MVTSLSANRTRATTRVTTATLTLAAQRHQTRNALLLPPCAMSTTAAAANTTESNARNSNAATATATLRLRQAGRTRHEVLALAYTLPLSQSHTHIALDSHSCLVLFVQLRAAKTKRRHNFVSIRRSSCSPSRSLSLSRLRGRPSGLWESAAHNQNKTFYNLRAAVFRRCRRVSDGFGF